MPKIKEVLKNNYKPHYEKKLTKNIRPTDILQIYTSMFSNLLNI